jgi:hypothetical protein
MPTFKLVIFTGSDASRVASCWSSSTKEALKEDPKGIWIKQKGILENQRDNNRFL